MFVDMHYPASSSSIPPQALPPWMHNALRDTHLRYPYDAFDVTAHLRQNPSTGGVVTVFRMICGDCPGKYYTPGPGDTLCNFEIHLKNRAHRARVQARMQPRRSML